MKSLDELLKEIRDRSEAATPGPWWAKGSDIWRNDKIVFGHQTTCAFAHLWSDDKATPDFIAAARIDVPKLLAVIERLINQRDDYIANQTRDSEHADNYKVGDNFELVAILLEGK